VIVSLVHDDIRLQLALLCTLRDPYATRGTAVGRRNIYLPSRCPGTGSENENAQSCPADAQRNELLRELERKNIAIDLAPIEAQSATRIKSDPRYLAPAW